MMFNWSLDVGNLITIFSLLVGGVVFVKATRDKLDNMASRLLNMEVELRKLIDVLIQQGKHEERMNALANSMVAQGARLDELTRRFNNKVEPSSAL